MDLGGTLNEEGKTISCAHAAARYQDPYWYDESGPNPLVAREIFKLPAGEVRTRRLRDIVHEYERYGAAMYEIAAEADRADIIRLLFEDDNGEDRFHSPEFTVNPPLSDAAIADRLECMQALVDEVGVWIDEPDACGGSTALLYAMAYGHVEVLKFLLSRGASIVTREEHADMVALALKRGNADVAKVVIESEQWKASGVEINLGHLRYAAEGGNVELAQLVISSCSVPLPTGNLGDLTEPQRDAILRAISFAIQAGDLACLQLLLPCATCQQPDGSYEYFRGDDFYEHVSFQLVEEVIEKRDDPGVFRIVWETIVCHPDAVKYDPTSRLAVVSYLLENTNADLTIAQGRFANRMTPLFLSVTGRESEMVQLLLEFGGPVESIDESLYTRIEGMEPGEEIKVSVVCRGKQPRCPVEIWASQNYEKTPTSEQVTRLNSEWERDELLELLKGLKIRGSDAELLRTDPKGRPLAKAAKAAKA